MGVNLPAHLVVIKSTMQYVAGSCEEYSDADMLQMIGRAGRPQVMTEKWNAVLIFLPQLVVVGSRGWWIDWWSVTLSLWNQTWTLSHHSALFFPSSLTHQRLQWSWQRSKTKTSTWSLWMEQKSLRAGTVMHLSFLLILFLCQLCIFLTLLSGRWDNSVLFSTSLHSHLVEHLNAEIVLQTISDVNMALEWIRSTFLYIRALKNPSHYGQHSEQWQITATVQVIFIRL